MDDDLHSGLDDMEEYCNAGTGAWVRDLKMSDPHTSSGA